MNKKKKKNISLKNPLYFILIFPFLAVLINIVWFFEGGYWRCISTAPTLCITSKIFVSPDRLYSFRYPEDYPMSSKTADELKQTYHSDFGTVERVEFTKDFYPNAGGDRLGSVSVKNTKYQNFQDFYDHYFGLKQTPSINNVDPGMVVPPKQEDYYTTTIAGEKALCENIPQNVNSFNPPEDTCQIFHSGKIYQISFYYNDYYHTLPKSHYEAGRKIILSTFRFLK